MTDPFDLDRFVQAQDAGGSYQRALEELRSGRKASHWMWFVFPQIEGLGSSAMSRLYAISGLEEATAYDAHPVLGGRLLECASVLTVDDLDRSAERIFGAVDAQKLRSSMTLFVRAAADAEVYRQVLERYFDGSEDQATLARLGGTT